MNERFELLMKLAKLMTCDEWDLVYNLAEMAKTEKERDQLRDIAKRLYLKHQGTDI